MLLHKWYWLIASRYVGSLWIRNIAAGLIPCIISHEKTEYNMNPDLMPGGIKTDAGRL